MTWTAPGPGAYDDLSRLLWQVRRLVERLEVQLRVHALALDAGDTDVLAHTVDELHHTAEALADADVARHECMSDIGMATGIGGSPSLAEIAADAPEPFDEILAEHHRAFVELTAATAAAASYNQRRIDRALQQVQLRRAAAGDRLTLP